MKAWLPAARQDPFVNLSLRPPSAARRGERHQVDVDVGERGRGLRLAAALAPDRRQRPPAGEDAPEEPAGVARPDPGDLLGSALGDDLATARPTLGAHVDDPVRALDDVEVVLDDNDRVALVDQALQDAE